MMNGVKDKPSKPSLEELLRHSKIISVHKECPSPKLDNLKRILEAVDGTKFGNDIPVAMVAVIGPKGSGKSFLTNFLIQYMKQEGEGGWMSSLMTHNGFAEGFSFGSISSEKFYDPKSEASCGSTSGIYLWPEPFLMTKTGDKKLIVWIVHVHSVPDDSKENLTALEQFLMLTCSRIMEIKWNNDEEFRILQNSQFLSDYDSSLQNQICDSVVYTFRSGKKVSADTDEEAMETLRELLQEAGKCETYKKFLSNCKHVNITWMKDIPQPLHDDKGAFSAKMKTVQKPIRVIVDKMLEESEIDGKCEGGNQLTLGNMVHFVEAAANKILASGPHAPLNPDEKTKPTDDTNWVASPLYSKPMESISTSNLTNGTTPVHHLDQNDESRNMEKSENINDTKKSTACRILPEGNDENPRPLTKTHEKRESFSSELIGPLVTNAKVGGGNDTSLLSADKEEEINNVGGSNDQNQNSTKIVKQVIHLHQSPAAAPVPPETSKPNNSYQKKEVLNSEMEVDHPSTHEVSEASTVLEPEENGRNSTEPMDIDDDGMVEKAVHELQDGKSNELEFKKKQQEEKKLERERKREEENRRKEQERQKKQEENRRQEEEARSVMMECFNITVLQVRKTFRASIIEWINQHLSFKTLNRIEGIYADIFRGTTEGHRQVVNPKLWNEFGFLVDKKCKNECISVLRSISELLLQFNRAVKKQFDFHGYFNAPKFEKMFNEEFHKLKIPQDEFISDMLKLAIDKLLIIYQQHNELIIDEERNNFKIATSQIENLYHEQMKIYMQDAPYSPQKLESIHKKLLEKLVDAFRKAFHLSTSVSSFIATLEDPLKEILGKKYKYYETSNDTKLRKLQSEINKIILKFKMKHNENIEAVLSQYPDGVEVRVLTKHNDSIRAEAMKLLEMEIRSKVREDEPVENHQKVLQSHIDSYWSAVIETNLKNIKRKKERDEEEQREKNKAEAQRKVQQQNSETERRKSATSSTAAPRPQIQHQQNKSNRKSMAKGDGKPLLQTPLVFHLQSSRIVMAMAINGHPTVLENEFGETQTSACVAFTSENEFVYGSAAFALAHDDNPDSGTILFWSVADLFINGNSLRTARVCINGTDHEITPEFLLAILLNSLKEAAEHQMNGQFTTTVIAIPFSFSSLQRIQVKDAAKIAGFSEVYLVNDASAAAYNLVLSDMRSESAAEVLFLSENFDRVDAFVYQYNGLSKKLIMLAHASNYDTENEKKKASLLKKITKGLSNAMTIFLSYMSPNGNESRQDDVTTGCVRKVCKFATEEACKSKSKPLDLMESFFICENLERWSATLSYVARDFGRKACDINQESAVVVGAVVLSKNPKDIGRTIRDKLAYSVWRTQSPVGCVMVCPWKTQLPAILVKHQTSLPGGVSETSFYQDVLGNNHDIGSLSVADKVLKDQYIEPSIDITNEGIVKFKYVTKNSSRSNYKQSTTATECIPEELVKWKTPNLTDEQLAMMLSLLDSIKVPKEDPALVQAKSCVLEKCKEIEDKIAEGIYKVKSDLGREMVAKKIAEAKQFASHANASLDNINKQIESLQRLCDKYEKK